MKDRLLIKKIEISNCGGFDGNHSIECSSESEKNFTIIIGTSGRGKSTIFQLIHWCLYGEHFDKRDQSTATDEGIINLPQLESMEEGDSVTGKVTLKINNQDGEKYVLERTITATKKSDLSREKFDEINNSKMDEGIQTETSCKLKLKVKGNDVWEKNEDVIDNEIRAELPLPLKDFFLFDGEKLVSFRTKAGSSRLIQDGIEKISGLNVLDSLINDVKYTSEKISKSIQGKSVSSKGLGNRKNTLDGELEELKDERDRIQKEITDKDALEKEVVEKISSSKEGKRIEDLIKNEERLLKIAEKQRKRNENEMHEFLFEKIPLILISDTLRESEKLFTELERMNLIPPSVTREALDKIFQEKQCICGNEFQENDKTWEKLSDIKKAVLDKDTTSGITGGRHIIGQMLDRSNNTEIEKQFLGLQNSTNETDREIIEAKARRSNLLTEQQNIGKIKGMDYDEMVQLRKDLLTDLAGLRADEKENEEEIITKEEQLAKATTEYNNKLAHEGQHETELAKQSILNAIKRYSEKKRKEIIERLRAKTEEFTGKYFKSSAPQASEFADLPPKGIGPVKISKNYDITAINKEGREKTLSKGQAHVLGLSYVSGCRQITSMNPFLFIDSPLHNISGYSRNDIAQVLTKHLPDVQIVLFVTDTEYTSGDQEGAKAVREFLNPKTKVWKEWIIHVTCTECKDEILYQSKESDDKLVCKNCNKIYDKENDPTGRRLITEYERDV